MAVSRFFPHFQMSARAETSHVIATKFQPGGRAEISARAETRLVIGPLVKIHRHHTSGKSTLKFNSKLARLRGMCWKLAKIQIYYINLKTELQGFLLLRKHDIFTCDSFGNLRTPLRSCIFASF